MKENVRESRAGAPIESSLRDLQYAARVLRKSPGFTIVAVLTLALAIGANTAIFSVINAVMLRSLPVDHPEQLALLTDPAEFGAAMDTTENGARQRLSYPEFSELRAHNTVFTGLVAAQNEVNEQDLYREGERSAQPLRVRTELVSGDFFDVLGVRPIRGRVFTAAEDRAPGASPVAVISYDFWQREFAGAETVLDAKIRVGKGVFQILGVTPPEFHGVLVGANADIWFPITMQEQVLPGRAEKTRIMFGTLFNAIDRLVKPERLGNMNAARLDEFAALLRKEGKAEATIKTYLAHLRGCLVWAARLKWIPAVPDFPETLRAPKADGAMKGRPVTGEELWKLLRATRKVVGPKVAKHYRRLLVGLW